MGGLFTGDWNRAGRGVKDILTSPFAVGKDIKFGIVLNKSIIEHGMGLPGEVTSDANLKLARILVGGGQLPNIETNLIKVMTRHFKEAFKLNSGLSLGQRGGAILRGLSSPLMEWVVPFSKFGVTGFKYMREVERWERQNPGKAPTEADMQNIAYRTRQNTDFIYGQMARDNVAMSAMVRSLLTGVIQFPNWQVGSVGIGVRALIGTKDVVGKVADMMQSKEIRQLDIKDRQVLQYAAGLILTIGMTGGMMTYAMTGKKPETMADYFFPRTGETNPNGSNERLQLPSYFKDAMGVTHHPFRTIGAKLASPIQHHH